MGRSFHQDAIRAIMGPTRGIGEGRGGYPPATSSSLRPIQADAPKLHVSGFFDARQWIVQNGGSADGCTGMHKMERILARTVPVMGAVSGLGSSRKCHGHEQDCHQIAIFRGAELVGEGFVHPP